MNVARINTELFENKVQVFEKAGWFIDKQEVLDYVQKRDEAKAKAKERREAKEEEIAFRERLRREKKESKALQKKQWHVDQKEQDLKREEFLSKGWIDASEACDLGAPKNIKHSSQKFGIRIIAFTHNLAKLYNREDVLKHVSCLKKLDEAKLKGAFGVKRGGQIVILKDQNDPFPYETRMFNLKFPEWKNVKKKLKSIKTNELYRDQHFNHNKIVELKCSACDQHKPYHEFRYTKNKRGRNVVCKACADKRYQDNKEEVLKQMKERWKIPWVKMRVIICSQIQKDISLVNGVYFEVQTSTIWNEIQKQCGYDEQDLVRHLQDQFGPKMSWDNHARSTVGFRWEIDHIIPRSELRYDSLQHPNFKKCWGLDNLRPLCAKENKSRWFIDKQT